MHPSRVRLTALRGEGQGKLSADLCTIRNCDGLFLSATTAHRQSVVASGAFALTAVISFIARITNAALDHFRIPPSVTSVDVAQGKTLAVAVAVFVTGAVHALASFAAEAILALAQASLTVTRTLG